jgi:hypothetical protein
MHSTYMSQLATGCTVQGSKPSGGEIFCAHPDQPRGSSSLLWILALSQGQNGQDMVLTTHPLLRPRLQMGWRYTSASFLCLQCLSCDDLYFTYISYKRGGKLWTEYCKILWNTTLIPSSIHESHRVQRNLTNHGKIRYYHSRSSE